MRIIETKAYTYDELNDVAKEKARDWWAINSCGEDLRFAMECHEENDGVAFAEWGTYPHYVRISWGKTNALDLLFAWLRHGRGCSTYKIAKETLHELHRARSQWVPQYYDSDSYEDIGTYKRDWWEEECGECQAIFDEFKQEAESEYENILRAEEEYLHSEENMAETFRSGNYEFTEDGNLI